MRFRINGLVPLTSVGDARNLDSRYAVSGRGISKLQFLAPIKTQLIQISVAQRFEEIRADNPGSRANTSRLGSRTVGERPTASRWHRQPAKPAVFALGNVEAGFPRWASGRGAGLIRPPFQGSSQKAPALTARPFDATSSIRRAPAQFCRPASQQSAIRRIPGQTARRLRNPVAGCAGRCTIFESY